MLLFRFIFLFRWTEERRARRKVVETAAEIFVKDEEKVNSIFFAQQVGKRNIKFTINSIHYFIDFGVYLINSVFFTVLKITVPNSCATHALLSILLNCPDLHLGDTLTRLKTHTKAMSPENKGWAIGNTPELACAHNSHAMTQAKRRLDKSSGISTGRFTGEAFHFVSFVPIDGHLFELDGLKPFPMNHGPWKESEDWTEKFRCTMEERLGISSGEQDIRFNLMAVVPDRRIAITQKLKTLKINKAIVTATLEKLIKAKTPPVIVNNENDAKPKSTDDKLDTENVIKIEKIENEEETKAADTKHEETKEETDKKIEQKPETTIEIKNEDEKTCKEDEPADINILHRLSLQNESLVSFVCQIGEKLKTKNNSFFYNS